MSTLKRDWRNRLVNLTIAGVVATMSAMAMAATPAESIKERQKNLKATGEALKTINDTLKTSAPDKAAIKQAGLRIKSTADAIDTWFPKGTGPEAGVETAAKPGIWSDPSDFAAKVKVLRAEVAKLVPLTEAGDVDGVRAQVRATGKSCGNCHDTYRVKKES